MRFYHICGILQYFFIQKPDKSCHYIRFLIDMFHENLNVIHGKNIMSGRSYRAETVRKEKTHKKI